VKTPTEPAKPSEPIRRLIDGRHHDPFQVLGRHGAGTGRVYRVFNPHARQVRIAQIGVDLEPQGCDGLFELRGSDSALPDHPTLEFIGHNDAQWVQTDPYAFPPQIGDLDLHLFGEGRHRHAWRFLGAHMLSVDGHPGVLFATWAPNAERVSVVGHFNQWDGRCHPMRVRGDSGIWELFLPGVSVGDLYRFELRHRKSGAVVTKIDPYGHQFELRPATAARVTAPPAHVWQDRKWMDDRADFDWQAQPMSVYEVHLGSWRRGEDGAQLSYREIAPLLVEHVQSLGFTHIELLPVTEYPLDESWGYQVTGFFAPTARFGTPDDFRWLVDHCHQNGIGVLLDWVPGHFPKDEHALARFDGQPLYEHPDPRQGEHREWGTLVFDYGRNEVRCFLTGSATYWLETFHLDGLRVDAVASMLYLDYSREPGDWLPNRYGGNENLEAIEFLRALNESVQTDSPGILMIAEESTSWPQVTRPPWVGGLGFTMKWNMGWMHDTLTYLSFDPVYRHFHHQNLTFGLLYAFSENFMLPLSHDEVVHGKGSMLSKMAGDHWQKLANLRLLYAYQWTYPGKKLLFMGSEFAQEREWSEARSLDWWLLEQTGHAGLQRLIGDLNAVYRDRRSLYARDFESSGFEWVDCNDTAQSVLSYLRLDGDQLTLVVLNFTPVVRHGYRVGVPVAGAYREHINTDSVHYGGSNVGNQTSIRTSTQAWMGHPHSLALTLPPLAALILVPEPTR